MEGKPVAPGRPIEVLLAATRLGLTSFGGPVAHLGYFHREYVVRRRWLDEDTYAELVALCQFLPGPASSELGIAVGTLRAGYLGGALAWLGFTAPSAVALVAFALLTRGVDVAALPWVHGLKIAAVSIVAFAVWSMARRLTPDLPRLAIAIAALGAMLAAPDPVLQVAVIGAGALLGWTLLRPSGDARPVTAIAGPVAVARGDGSSPGEPATGPAAPVSRRVGLACLAAFGGLLVALPLLRAALASQSLAVFDAFYRAGGLVFGGGHVVLPLLHSAVVPAWVGDDRFLAGYGAAQAVPGPLFTFAAYLGAVLGPQPNGVLGASIALAAIFLPAFLLIWGALPFWDSLRRSRAFGGALRGANAAVVGILAAALYSPIASSAVHSPPDLFLAGAGLGLVFTGRVPPAAVVAGAAIACQALGLT